VSRLYVRRLDAAARLVDGADAPTSDGLAFSPDGQWLAFVTGDKLTKVRIGGGAPTSIATVRSAGNGIAWPTGDMIVLGPRSIRGRGLLAVSASSGEVRALTRPDTGARGEIHVDPYALPGGKHVLLWIQGRGGAEDDFIAIAALATGNVSRLPIVGAPVGVVGGYLIFRDLRTQSLMSVSFDLEHLRVMGAPTRVADPVEEAAASAAGVLVTRNRTTSQLQWVGADGSAGLLLLDHADAYRDPRLSPDQKRIALSVGGPAGAEVMIHEIAAGTSSRLASDGRRPEWTPDGARVLFRAFGVKTGLGWEPSDFSGSTEPLAVAATVTDAAITEGVVSPDGRTLLYVSDGDLFTLPLDRDTSDRHARARPFHVSSAYNCMPRFSPDGRWVAFQSNISGQEEVYVLPFPGPGGRYQVSARGGTEPVWATNGRLYYRHGQQMIAAKVALAPAFAVVSRTVLFEGDYLADGSHPQYDVAHDGRLLMLPPAAAPRAISVVLDWRPER
jgi:Tol biopolymer transport system component